MNFRDYFVQLVPETRVAVACLSKAAAAHASGDFTGAFDLLKAADCEVTHRWTRQILGPASELVHGPGPAQPIAKLSADQLYPVRMPGKALQQELIDRDGWRCRFCGLELISRETLKRIIAIYPSAANWQQPEDGKHALLRIMSIQFDHVLPHSRGGGTELENMILTCAPCNYGRGSWTLEECRLNDPRDRPVIPSNWNGLVGEFQPGAVG